MLPVNMNQGPTLFALEPLALGTAYALFCPCQMSQRPQSTTKLRTANRRALVFQNRHIWITDEPMTSHSLRLLSEATPPSIIFGIQRDRDREQRVGSTAPPTAGNACRNSALSIATKEQLTHSNSNLTHDAPLTTRHTVTRLVLPFNHSNPIHSTASRIRSRPPSSSR